MFNFSVPNSTSKQMVMNSINSQQDNRLGEALERRMVYHTTESKRYPSYLSQDQSCVDNIQEQRLIDNHPITMTLQSED